MHKPPKKYRLKIVDKLQIHNILIDLMSIDLIELLKLIYYSRNYFLYKKITQPSWNKLLFATHTGQISHRTIFFSGFDIFSFEWITFALTTNPFPLNHPLLNTSSFFSFLIWVFI